MIVRKAKQGQIRHAEICSGDGRFRLIAVLTPDGWLAHSYAVGTGDEEHQGEWPDLESAVKQLEWYARHTLSITDPINWSDDPNFLTPKT